MKSSRSARLEDWDEMDNITKNIVQEIVRECNILKLKLDQRFCGYYVKLLILDPKWKISSDIKINRENIEALVNHCNSKLKLYPCPSLKTLRMQHHFLTHLVNKLQMIEIHRTKLLSVLAPLEDDIINFDINGNKPQEDRLTRRITLYATCASGLGNPKNQMVMKEALTAFKSICDETELHEFCRLTPTEKLKKLQLFQQLITGIRLFNRDCGKPAADIEDLPKLLTKAIQATQSILQNELLKVMEKVNITTSAVEQVYFLNKTDENEFILKLILPADVTISMYEYALEFLVYSRQHEVYIRKMLSDVAEVENYTKELFNNLHKIFVQLHTIVKYRVAVPTTTVYPLFEQLATIWKKLQDEMIILSFLNTVYNDLFTNLEDEPINYDILQKIVKKNQIITDSRRLEKTMGFKISKENNKCTILEPSNIKEYTKLPLQFLGFCAWTLVVTEGALLPGNPNMGICKWKDKYYVFAYREGAEMFGKQPDFFVNRALDVVRNKPELINLLNLYETISMTREINTIYKSHKEQLETRTVEIQTDLHPIEFLKDPSYSWNMFEHYKKAIKLANISNSVTKSSQTIKSNYRQSKFSSTDGKMKEDSKLYTK